MIEAEADSGGHVTCGGETAPSSAGMGGGVGTSSSIAQDPVDRPELRVRREGRFGVDLECDARGIGTRLDDIVVHNTSSFRLFLPLSKSFCGNSLYQLLGYCLLQVDKLGVYLVMYSRASHHSMSAWLVR